MLLGCCLALCQAVAQDADTATFRKWALTPPLGWNSWDCYYSSDVVAYTTDGHAVDVDINWPEGSKTLVLVMDDGGDNFNYDHGDWINPTLVLRDGREVPLTGIMATNPTRLTERCLIVPNRTLATRCCAFFAKSFYQSFTKKRKLM
ncbi:NPCBM/NEW2 domain-containing protein [Hallella faecis]|uniref:NPCBM/NEW2 domain-containing protein n=1 Tax=Hallella faecis TaxID=2841596 RepID=UPI003F8ECF5D